MYTWGYIKEATLAELDITLKAAIDNGFMNKFPFAANAILTQICSAIKPKWTSQLFKVRDREKLLRELLQKYDVLYFNEYSGEEEMQLRDENNLVDLSFLGTKPCQEEDLNVTQLAFLKEYKTYTLLNTNAKMPDDFISFDIVPTTVVRPNGMTQEAYDTDYKTIDANSIMFFTEGDFYIPYNARWYTFLPTTEDRTVLPIPTDILDCLPLYIASRCLKVDDEYKAGILRNELELALSRIDNSRPIPNKTFKVEGDWA